MVIAHDARPSRPVWCLAKKWARLLRRYKACLSARLLLELCFCVSANNKKFPVTNSEGGISQSDPSRSEQTPVPVLANSNESWNSMAGEAVPKDPEEEPVRAVYNPRKRPPETRTGSFHVHSCSLSTDFYAGLNFGKTAWPNDRSPGAKFGTKCASS